MMKARTTVLHTPYGCVDTGCENVYFDNSCYLPFEKKSIKCSTANLYIPFLKDT